MSRANLHVQSGLDPRVMRVVAAAAAAASAAVAGTEGNDQDDHIALLQLVRDDLRSQRRRTSVLCVFALAFLIAQVSTATISTMMTLSDYFEMGYIFSGLTALLLTIEGALQVRERAASAFVAVNRLRGIQLQLEHSSGPLGPSSAWMEYADVNSSRKVNYIEGIFMPWL
jgi:hypothetical protein